jgi:hypothetical protein
LLISITPRAIFFENLGRAQLKYNVHGIKILFVFERLSVKTKESGQSHFHDNTEQKHDSETNITAKKTTCQKQ